MLSLCVAGFGSALGMGVLPSEAQLLQVLMEKAAAVSSSHLARGIVHRLYLCCKPGTGSAANSSLSLLVLCRLPSEIA